MTLLRRSSNWPRYIVPATSEPTSSWRTRLPSSGGHITVGDALGQAFDDGGLADARFTDEGGVVLGAASQNLDHTLNFLFAANDRVELVFLGHGG